MAGSVPVLTVFRHPLFLILFAMGQKLLVHAGTPSISKQHFMVRAKILPQFVHASNAVGDTVDPSNKLCSNCAENAEKPLPVTSPA